MLMAVPAQANNNPKNLPPLAPAPDVVLMLGIGVEAPEVVNAGKAVVDDVPSIGSITTVFVKATLVVEITVPVEETLSVECELAVAETVLATFTRPVETGDPFPIEDEPVLSPPLLDVVRALVFVSTPGVYVNRALESVTSLIG